MLFLAHPRLVFTPILCACVQTKQTWITDIVQLPHSPNMSVILEQAPSTMLVVLEQAPEYNVGGTWTSPKYNVGGTWTSPKYNFGGTWTSHTYHVGSTRARLAYDVIRSVCTVRTVVIGRMHADGQLWMAACTLTDSCDWPTRWRTSGLSLRCFNDRELDLYSHVKCQRGSSNYAIQVMIKRNILCFFMRCCFCLFCS